MVRYLITGLALLWPIFVQSEPCRILLDEAMGIAMQYQWNIAISREAVYGQAGIVEQTAGPFDPVFDGRYRETHLFDAQNPNFALKSHKEGQVTNLDVAWKKTARIGTIFTVDGSLIRTHNPLLFPDRINNFFMTFAVDQPLLRRFRYNLASVNERIALLELEALKGDFIQTIAAQLRIVAQAYWDLVAAQSELAIRKQSQARLDSIAESTRKLIEGNQMAPAELNLQLAELARAKRQRDFAEQAVYAAYNNLRLAMGQEAVCSCSEVPDLELEDYPAISDDELPPIRELQQIATDSRWDLYARELRTDEANEQVTLAATELLPDLSLKAGTTVSNSQAFDRARNFFTPVTSSLPEVDTFAEIRISVPFYNDEARGNYRRRTADRIQSFYQVRQLFEEIRLGVATAASDHVSLREQRRDADNAVKWYQAALDAELRKLKEGYSTLFFVLDYQDRLSNAQSEQNDTYRRYAENIADLLFLTGQLVLSDCAGNRVTITDVRSLDTLTE